MLCALYRCKLSLSLLAITITHDITQSKPPVLPALMRVSAVSFQAL
jgi:hypothetical protein